MPYSIFDVMQAARKARPEVKWEYAKLNDAISEMMPVEYDGLWSPGRLCAHYSVDTDSVLKVDNYCVDINNRFPSKEEAQAYIDALVF